jgi:hypothetical protein
LNLGRRNKKLEPDTKEEGEVCGTDRMMMMKKNSMVTMRSACPRNDGTSDGIDDHIGFILHITLIILTCGALMQVRKRRALIRVSGRIR